MSECRNITKTLLAWGCSQNNEKRRLFIDLEAGDRRSMGYQALVQLLAYLLPSSVGFLLEYSCPLRSSSTPYQTKIYLMMKYFGTGRIMIMLDTLNGMPDIVGSRGQGHCLIMTHNPDLDSKRKMSVVSFGHLNPSFTLN